MNECINLKTDHLGFVYAWGVYRKDSTEYWTLLHVVRTREEARDIVRRARHVRCYRKVIVQ